MTGFVRHAKEGLPWWARIASKMVLARIPVDYKVWQRIGLFRHGYMDDASYALSVFESHVRRAGLTMQALNGKVMLEMGPGDSVATAIIAHTLGARAILVDAGAFASSKPLRYEPLCAALRVRGLAPIEVSQFGSIGEVLDACGAVYLTRGANSWESLASESVDLVFSQAVLEHVRLREFDYVQEQCFRVMRSGGVASHTVDLKDHLGGALDNLRFSRKIWESESFVRSGFYTNRLRMARMLDMFTKAGFDADVLEVKRWETLPTRRKSLDSEFSSLPDTELLVSGFNVLLRRR